jgi:hypothetical protein
MAKHQVIFDGDWFEILEIEAPENATDEQILRTAAQQIINNTSEPGDKADERIADPNTPNPNLTIRQTSGAVICRLIIPME